jgi:putative PEP-CTERM system TPR-repeat lipoprotein
MQNRDFSKGAEYLQKATEIAPAVSAIKAQLALSHLATGETDEAVTELESAIDLGQGLIQADILLILAHLQQQEFDKAIAAATTLVEKLPENPISHNLLGVAYMASGEDGQARQAFEQALKVQSGFSTATLNLARLDLKAGDRKKAEARLHQILKQQEGHLEAMLGLASLAEQDGRPAEVLSWLEKAWEKNPQALKAGLPLAQQYLARNENLKALNVARSLQSANPDNPLAVRALGLALMANDNNASALANFRKLTELLPRSPEAWHLVAMAQFKAEDYKAAARALDRALAAQSDYLPSLVARTELQLRDRRFEEALDSARDIQARHPDAAIGHKLEGDAHVQHKQFDKAVDAYQEAYDKSPASQLALLLGNTRWLAGEQEAAVDWLQEWLKEEPGDNQVRMQLAMYLQQMNRQTEAIAEYEKLAGQNPKNIVVLNNLAWLYNEAGNPRAVEYAERAMELAPDRPEIADTLGWILVQNEQAQRGVRILQQAAVQAPHLAEIRYHLAVAYD